ncbi:DNRLRE domain-containing protein [Haloechinothrix sp. YIM 98757]|uniref:DNRLRE domain-containing protein n=1 Tax=Haloechinothrix aidingensis TaxID=2752311 RepID=A0A838AFN2_9PSEU|nr:LamG-like jellyroll fold domain-containing protein [Haloechinothrix aidingensis]MBA0127928.1 DNRLRE domain-containing protein [Haloechinothrix aidingensis]
MSRVGQLRPVQLLSIVLVLVLAAGLLTHQPWSASAGPGELPEQREGTAEGRSHEVPSGATDERAGLATEHDAPLAEGLDADERHPVPRLKGATEDEAGVEVGDPADVEPTERIGFDAERSREIEDERGPARKVFENPDGSRTVRHFQGPRHFKDDGSWRTIDTDLVSRGNGWRAAAVDGDRRFARSAKANTIVRMGLDGRKTVGFGIEDAEAALGEVSGDTITYPDVRRDADLELQVTPGGVKEDIVLHSPDAPAEWAFPLELKGLTASLTEDGAVELVDADGETEAVIPPGYMEDANVDERSGDGALSYDVDYELTGEPGKQVLHVSADPEWLAADEREWPVRIDPSVSRKDSNGSTYVQSPYHNDYSGEANLKVGTFNGGDNKSVSFLKFDDVTSDLDGMYVLGARLNLYNTWSYSCNDRTMTVRPVTEPWSVSGNKSFPGPDWGSVLARKSFAYGYSSSCGSRWVGIDLGDAGRDLVQGWVRGEPNHGLRLSASMSDSYGWKKFASAASANPPSLDVTYTEHWAEYSVGDMTDTVTSTDSGSMRVTVTNDGKDTWTPDNDYKLGYQLWDGDGNKLPWREWTRFTDMPTSVATGESVTLDAEIRSLPPGEYTLRWDMGKVGTGWFSEADVPMSAPVTFTIPNRKPVVESMSPPSNFEAGTLTPSLMLSGSDPDGWPGDGLEYQFRVCDSSGDDCTTSDWRSSARWQVPEGTLSWGETYSWQGRISDTEDAGRWTDRAYLSTHVAQPAITSNLASASEEDGKVDPAVGNYTMAATDADVATVGPSLAVNRTYNSLDPRDDLTFGAGWTTRWDMRLVPDEDGSGNVVVTYPDGKQARYGKEADGSYATPAGQVATLVADGDGWVLRAKGGTRYRFDSAGRIVEITDGEGRVQQLEHDTDGRLERATDTASGRYLDFAWSGGHVTEVTTGPDPAVTWTYSYDGSRLIEACDPTDVCTEYTYEPGGRYRSTTLDANPDAYWRLAEPDGETATSEQPGYWSSNDGTLVDIAHGQDGPLQGVDSSAAGFNGESSMARIPEEAIHGRENLTLEMWFKTTEPGALFGYQNWRLGDGKETHYVPALYIGSDGQLRGQWWAGDATPITTDGAVTDGQWHHVALSGAGDTQTLYLDGTEVGSRGGRIDHLDMTSNQIGAAWVEHWPSQPDSEPVSHFSGSIGEVAIYHRPLGATTIAEHYAARSAGDRLTGVTGPGDVPVASITYDDATSRVAEHTDEHGGTYRIGTPEVSGDGHRYREAVTGSRPDAYWQLDESEGSTADGNSELRRGVYYRAGGGQVDGPFPGSHGRSFDGQDSYATLPAHQTISNNQMSVELWFKTTSDDGGVLFSTGNFKRDDTLEGTGSTPVLYVGTDGKLYGHFWNGQAEGISTSGAVNDGEWHHVTLSATDDHQTMYLDGDQVGTLDGEISTDYLYNYVGTGVVTTSGWPARPEDPWGHFEGAISHLALYQRPVSESEVSSHYAARDDRDGYRDTVRGTGPVGLWGLEEGDSALRPESDPRLSQGTYHDVDRDVQPPMEGAGAAGFDGQSSYVRLPDSLVQHRTRTTVELWFRTTSQEGGALFASADSLPGDTETPGAMPILYVGTDGKLHGQFWNGTVDGITSDGAVNDGEWHHVALRADRQRQWLHLDGSLVGSQAGEINSKRKYHFVGTGKFTLSGGEWAARPEDDWGFFEGDIADVAVYQRGIGPGEISDHYAASVAAHSVDITDPAGNVTTRTYDPTGGGRLVSKTDPAGATTVYTYDTGGFVHTITDPNGGKTWLAHDERGNEVTRKKCRTDGTESCYSSYHSYFLNEDDPLDPRNDKVTEYRSARSATPSDDRYLTTYSYTQTGQVSKVVSPATSEGPRRETEYFYSDGTEEAPDGGTQPAGLLTQKVLPDGQSHWYDYTSAGDLHGETDPAGKKTWYSYDGVGRKVSETVGASDGAYAAQTTYSYDSAGRLLTETSSPETDVVTGEEHQERLVRQYRADGRLASETVEDISGSDPSRTTSYGYDALGRQDSTTDPEGGTESVVYDEFGEVVERTDKAGTRFTYTHTDAGRRPATTTVHGFSGDGGDPRDVVLESRAYDPAGRLAEVTDAMGNTTAYTYYHDGLLASEHLVDYEDPETGETRDFQIAAYGYTGDGQLSTEVRGDGRYTTETAYDPGGRPVKVFEYDGDEHLRTTWTTHDDMDNPTGESTVAPDGEYLEHTAYEYDPMGRVVREEVALDETEALVTEIERDQRGLKLSVTGPRGTVEGADAARFTTDYSYDRFGRQVGEVAPPVEVTSAGSEPEVTRPETETGYNTFGDVVAERDPNGNVTRYDYDGVGRQVSETRPDYTPPGADEPITATSTTSYDAAGRVVAETDAAGHETTYGYDELGNQRRVTDPPSLSGQAGGTTIATYTPTGLRRMVSDQLGAQTYATYDQLGRQITETVVEREPTERYLTTEFTYDELGNPASETDPLGRTTTLEHNVEGNPVSITDPAGVETTASYDAAGRPVETHDPAGVTTRLEYDAAGRVLEESDMDSNGEVLASRSFGYDAAGNRTSETDELGATTSYEFDAHDNLRSVTRPVDGDSSIVTSYGYDAAGNITRATDGNGNTTEFTVNSWGLPESTIEPATEQTPDAADRTYTVSYDARGDVATLAKPGGVEISNTYDPLGNLLTRTATGATAVTPDREFTYDDAGRRTRVSAPGGDNVYSYDDRGNLLSAEGPSGSTEFSWGDDGRLVQATTEAGTGEYGYDAAGRLSTATDPVSGATASYGYDDAGRVSTVDYGGVSRSYDYDESGRLVQDAFATDDGEVGSIAYGYDDAGRLTSKTTSGVAGAAQNTYTYDQAGRLSSWNDGDSTVDYTWDDAGNLVGRGDETAVFNERNQLLEHGSTQYSYTARGTLTERVEDGQSTDVEFNAFDELVADGGTSYTYDGLGRLIDRDGRGLSYVGASLDVASDGVGTYSYTPGGRLLGAGSGSGTGLGWSDRHTDLVGVIDPAGGELAGSRSFGPFGEVTASDGAQPDVGFQGQFTDPDSGNVHMGSRWYQPGTGTFASRDQAGLDPRDVGNANRYRYGASSPLSHTDPTGEWVQVILAVGAAGLRLGATVLRATAVAAARRYVVPFVKRAMQVYERHYGAINEVVSTLEDLSGMSSLSGTIDRYREEALRDMIYNQPVTYIRRPGVAAGMGTPQSSRRYTSSSPSYIGASGGAVNSAAAYRADKQAAREAARLAARRARVERDANTPHAPPDPVETIAPRVSRAIEERKNQDEINLGVLDPRSSDDQDVKQHYEPDGAGAYMSWPTGGPDTELSLYGICTRQPQVDPVESGGAQNRKCATGYSRTSEVSDQGYISEYPELITRQNGSTNYAEPKLLVGRPERNHLSLGDKSILIDTSSAFQLDVQAR